MAVPSTVNMKEGASLRLVYLQCAWTILARDHHARFDVFEGCQLAPEQGRIAKSDDQARLLLDGALDRHAAAQLDLSGRAAAAVRIGLRPQALREIRRSALSLCVSVRPWDARDTPANAPVASN